MKALRNNGLSIVLSLLFLGTLGGQSVAGYLDTNHEHRDHHESPVTFGQYLRSPEMLEATMENWESEFFQMTLYVVLTVTLFQKGSAESKHPDRAEEDSWSRGISMPSAGPRCSMRSLHDMVTHCA